MEFSIQLGDNHINFEMAVIPVHTLIGQVITHTGENHFRNHICNQSRDWYQEKSFLEKYNSVHYNFE